MKQGGGEMHGSCVLSDDLPVTKMVGFGTIERERGGFSFQAFKMRINNQFMQDSGAGSGFFSFPAFVIFWGFFEPSAAVQGKGDFRFRKTGWGRKECFTLCDNGNGGEGGIWNGTGDTIWLFQFHLEYSISNPVKSHERRKGRKRGIPKHSQSPPLSPPMCHVPRATAGNGGNFGSSFRSGTPGGGREIPPHTPSS